MSEEKKNSGVKQSFIAGSLVSTAGVFLSKFIGLFYMTPFSAIAGGAENIAYYSAAYNYYSMLLQICTAGIPFAIAAIVAKYWAREDYRTVVLVRRLGTGLLMASGLIVAVLFALFSKPLAISIFAGESSAADILKMQNTFVILSLALFLAPVLSAYRGYYQGLKEMKAYADSQVLEQFARVAFLLGLGALLVYGLHMDPMTAVYTGVLSTSIGALFALGYYFLFDRKRYGKVLAKARKQKTPSKSRKEVAKEIVAYGIPYLLAAFLGNSQTLVNTHFFIRVMTSMGTGLDEAKVLYAIIQTYCDKLTSIPQVLSVGFSAGIVPYMTVSLEKRDFKGLNRNIEDCLDTVLYIALPACFCLFSLAEPIYFVMYGSANLEYGTICLMWSALLGLTTTISPLCNSMMLTLKFRKASLVYLGVGFLVKCITFYPLIKIMGYAGAIVSSALCSLTVIYLSLVKIHNKFDAHYGRIGIRALKMCIGCIAMNGVFAIARLLGFFDVSAGRIAVLLQLAAAGILGALVYLFVTELMKLPKAVFHMDLKHVAGRLLRRA